VSPNFRVTQFPGYTESLSPLSPTGPPLEFAGVRAKRDFRLESRRNSGSEHAERQADSVFHPARLGPASWTCAIIEGDVKRSRTLIVRHGTGSSIKHRRPDEEFRTRGLTMRRYGRFIELHTHRTDEEQARLKQAIWESRRDIATRIQHATQKLSALIRKYSSFDLVGNLWLRQALFDPDEYKETQSTQRPHFVEHATMLQLREPEHIITPELVVVPEDVVRAEKLLADIFELTAGYYASEAANPEIDGPPTTIDEARFKTLLREMMVGPPAYTHHWRTILDRLFGAPHIDGYLREVLGFNLADAVACIRGISDLIRDTLTERSEAAKKSSEEMKERLKKYIDTGTFDGEPSEKPMFDAIRNMRSKERKRFISVVPARWVTIALADVLSFTPAELASKARVAEENASKFLSSFSLSLGSIPQDYVVPDPVPAVRARPVVMLNGSYLCVLPFNLVWAIKPRFEESLKHSTKWNSYQKQRGSVLVDEGLKALKRLLPASQVFKGLTYPIGADRRAELDGLVLFDRYAFLLEAKGGEFGAARRGGKDRIRKSLKELVGDPSEQGARAWDYIRKNVSPTFSTEGGELVSIDKIRHSEIAVITLTLDSLDVFTPQLHRLGEVGVLGQHDLPWAVCLTDLMAISEIFQFPVEFTHFLRWRLAINKAGDISAGTDELNWVAVYLKEGPQLLRVPQGFNEMSFTSYTDDVDAYFLYQGGFRTIPAERPAQSIPERLRRLLCMLESSGLHGFTEPCELLLDLDFKDRDKFARSLALMESVDGKDNKPLKFEAEEVSIEVFPAQDVLNEQPSRGRGGRDQNKKILKLGLDPSSDWSVADWLIVRGDG
jgi:hypothetical protein